MRRLRLPHSVTKRYRRFPRADAARFSPNGKAGNRRGGAEGPGPQGRKPEGNRRMFCLKADTAVAQKRKRSIVRSGLPSDNYWTGTENTDNPGNSWIVNDNDGIVNVNNDNQSNSNRVVCVP